MNIQELLDRSRKELLDLSTRNRLLSIPVGSTSARIIEIQDERSEEVFRILVREKKQMSFLPGRATRADVNREKTEDEDSSMMGGEEVGLPQPDDEVTTPNGVAKRHLDTKLQTSVSSEGLQRRLLDLFVDSLTMVEEQGVNILYLVLGHLKWFEAEAADTPRYAPLVLIPVQLERKTASEKFYIKWREEEIQENLSLQAKMASDFGVKLPEFPDEEELDVEKYFAEISKVIKDAKGWEVLSNSITLGFFSFAKFLMYRDLDAKNWPSLDKLLKNPFIMGLIQDGFPHSESLIPEDVRLDEFIPAERLDHVVDADSSQTLAIENVRKGSSLVIQGPPGTGKSQSITNIIASAILDGKKVLFVAEKLAALEVVKRRLEKEGLGALCLELHSSKSNKRSVIEDIGRTWKLGRPKAMDLESLVSRLEKHRGTLNGHAKALHEKLSPSELTPFAIIGQLATLGDRSKELSRYSFTAAEKWTGLQRQEFRKLAEELASRIEDIGLPTQHPWRGVTRGEIFTIDLPQIETQITTLASSTAELQRATANLASVLSQPNPATLAACEEQRIISEYVAKAPAVDKTALCNGVWNAGLDGLRDLLAEGEKFSAASREVGKHVTESCWESDFTEARSHIAAHGQSILRFLNGNYRRALAQLRGEMTVECPKAYSERLALIDQIIRGQQSLKKIRAGKSVGQEAFGSFWREEKTNWTEVGAIIAWISAQREVGLERSFRQMFAGIEDQNRVAALLQDVSTGIEGFRTSYGEVAATLNLESAGAFGIAEFERVPLEAVDQRCKLWLANIERLIPWCGYFHRAKLAREMGLGSLVDQQENGSVGRDSVTQSFDRIYFNQMFRQAAKEHPTLAAFDGALHENVVNDFRNLDRERLALAKYRVLLAHHKGMAPQGGVGPAGIVKSEMERKRGHRTVRRLLKDAGTVVQSIKPVFMMSPLSVAQFLEPGAVEFDLLIIDEASQVQPVDALGAIARSKQIVVLGDSKQLPPTRFFLRLTEEGKDNVEEEGDSLQVAEVKDIQSILGLCCARGLPETMLRWHYRSRHHSLIAVSNHEFYENSLFIVPSPYPDGVNFGLRFHQITEGVFDSGASGTNRVEAKAVCNAVIKHARNNPKESLGVAAFSIRQRQAILDELELLRRENPDTEEFFSKHATEPFFVKNLENVQGDERDVIFISVGYGRNAQGYMAMRFGPLSMEGGERRLNVLISRAKHRCEVFSSITADDIDLGRASGRGVAALKTFLSYAQTGRLAVARVSGEEEQSPFEEAVRKAVESLGYEVHPQVGIAGFFIDLAVLDQKEKTRYLLGIECDGAAYHSSRSARDRDRLRQAVLEDHGWIIHRIWSTDWFQRPGPQLQKLATAIERAKEVKNQVEASESLNGDTPENGELSIHFEREPTLTMGNDALARLSEPYKQASFSVPANRNPHELETKEMGDILLRIVQAEGPIHEDELICRVRDLWNLGRAGTRVHDAVARGVRSLIVTGRCSREEGFVAIAAGPVRVRNRENVASASLRKPEMLPPSEIRAGILALIEAHHGASKEEIPTAIARLLGFKVTSVHPKSRRNERGGTPSTGQGWNDLDRMVQ